MAAVEPKVEVVDLEAPSPVKEDPNIWWKCSGCDFTIYLGESSRSWRKFSHTKTCASKLPQPSSGGAARAVRGAARAARGAARTARGAARAVRGEEKARKKRREAGKEPAPEEGAPNARSIAATAREAAKRLARTGSSVKVPRRSSGPRSSTSRAASRASGARTSSSKVKKVRKNIRKKSKTIAKISDYKSYGYMYRAVWNGTKLRTVGGLTKEDLIRNPRGKIVSKRRSAHSSQLCRKNGWAAHWATWCRSVQAARKEQGVSGFMKVKKTGNARERGLHRRSVELWAAVKVRAIDKALKAAGSKVDLKLKELPSSQAAAAGQQVSLQRYFGCGAGAAAAATRRPQAPSTSRP